jgi:hypothetical protein
MLGSIGAAAQSNALGQYVPNQFFEQYEKAVNRKIDLMEKRYRARKDYLGAAQDGYARMRQILQDEQATRAMIEARAWQMFDSEVDKIAQQYSLDTQNAQYLTLRAGAANKYREKAMESARTTNHVVSQQEAFRPMTVVPTGGEDKTGEEIAKYDEERYKRGITAKENIMDLLNDAVPANIKDPAWNQEWAQYIYSGDPGIISTRIAQWVAKDPRALESAAAAVNQYAHEIWGAALTKNEIANRVKEATGSAQSLVHFLRRLQNDHRTQSSGLRAAYPRAAAIYDQRRGQILNSPESTYQPAAVRTDKPK